MSSQPLTGKFYDYVPTGTYTRQGTAANCNHWEYARIVRNIARNIKNVASADNDYSLHSDDADFNAIVAFLETICYWDVATQTYTGTRAYMGWKWNFKAISGLTSYVGNTDGTVTGSLIAGQPILDNQEKEKYYINGTKVSGFDGYKTIPTPTVLTNQSIVEPKWIVCGLLEKVSRDFKKVPLNAAEKTAVDTLLAAVSSSTLGSEKKPALGTQRFYGNVAGATITTTGGTKDISSNPQPRLM
jgi:hypothetical protein